MPASAGAPSWQPPWQESHPWKWCPKHPQAESLGGGHGFELTKLVNTADVYPPKWVFSGLYSR